MAQDRLEKHTPFWNLPVLIMKTLYPMDKEESLLALGEENLAERIKKCFAADAPPNLRTQSNGFAFPEIILPVRKFIIITAKA